MLTLLIATLLGWVVGNIVFDAFEQHVPFSKRVAKLAIVLGVLTAVGLGLGIIFAWGTLALMGVGIAVLHGWWFPKNGIHPITAEPRDEYLALIARMKRKS